LNKFGDGIRSKSGECREIQLTRQNMDLESINFLALNSSMMQYTSIELKNSESGTVIGKLEFGTK